MRKRPPPDFAFRLIRYKAAKDTDAEYVSVKLDDPSFTAPIYAALVQGDKRRAQAHLVALTEPRRLAPSAAARPNVGAPRCTKGQSGSQPQT
jgi:hypothetical protein